MLARAPRDHGLGERVGSLCIWEGENEEEAAVGGYGGKNGGLLVSGSLNKSGRVITMRMSTTDLGNG